MKKVELLAPAGCFESFKGAIHAGADAVYIGGRKYGARAYADNFTEEEVCLAIRYAHLFGRKLYLTVNTLVKEDELKELPAYLRPFYEEGLDGVIVQDLGVFSLLRECFPGLPLHGSTQMTVTGPGGAAFLQSLGASRVVPARELSLKELEEIRATGIEVEAFVHGSMCYCYSGQCLFSSMLGGRSGNRGRCAQPCRLPYEIVGQKGRGIQYPLSLKDLCTLSFLPELIQAGIDSFKIEGRMKKPEYAAGVTALYRKYIDRYFAEPSGVYTVSDTDMEKLRCLYIRSEIQEGYYKRHNGREMITPDRPGYLGTDEAYLKQIRRTFLEQAPRISVRGEAVLKKGMPAALKLLATDNQGADICIQAMGQMPQAARKQPLTKEDVKKQLCKTGNTPFALEPLEIDMDPDCFLPVKALNDLRRQGLAQLEEALLAQARRDHSVKPHAEDSGSKLEYREQAGEPSCGTGLERVRGKEPYISVQVEDGKQLDILWDVSFIGRLYLNGDMLFQEGREELHQRLKAWKVQGRQLFLVMPQIVRLRDEGFLDGLRAELKAYDSLWDGILIRNLESLQFLRTEGYEREIVADASLYVWNSRARDFWKSQGIVATAPLECSKEELHRLGIEGMEVIVYGRSLLMVTANCLRKTAMTCPKELQDKKTKKSQEEGLLLRDRYSTDFPVRTVCLHCYNELYNSVPLSLHAYGNSIMGEYPAGVRICFTVETAGEMWQVLNCYRQFVTEPGALRQVDFPYTKGHYKRGAE